MGNAFRCVERRQCGRPLNGEQQREEGGEASPRASLPASYVSLSLLPLVAKEAPPAEEGAAGQEQHDRAGDGRRGAVTAASTSGAGKELSRGEGR